MYSGRTTSYLFNLAGYHGPDDIVWDFGDGSPVTNATGGQAVLHEYMNCAPEQFKVSAQIQGDLGNCPIYFETPVSAGDTTVATDFRDFQNYPYGGRSARIGAKLADKVTWSKIKSKFRFRESGDKTIRLDGTLLVKNGGQCDRLSAGDLRLNHHLVALYDDPVRDHRRKHKQRIWTNERIMLSCEEGLTISALQDGRSWLTHEVRPECLELE